jgi:hypothetical protein
MDILLPMPHLRIFTIDNAKSSNITQVIAMMPNLNVFKCSNHINIDNEFLKTVGSLSKLTALSLTNCHIVAEDEQALENLTYLEELYLDGSVLHTMLILANLNSIKKAYLECKTTPCLFEIIPKWKMLEVLKVPQCEHQGILIYNLLKNLPNLRILQVCLNSPKGIGEDFQPLQTDITVNNILKAILNFKSNVMELHLYNCQYLTNQAIESLKTLPHSVVKLSFYNISKDIKDKILDLQKFRSEGAVALDCARTPT